MRASARGFESRPLRQKTFTVDFLTKKKKINEGEVQQYYIENSHPAIIPPETFDLVSIEIERRKGQRKSTAGIFASKLICGECGSYYGSKVWHSNDKYRRVIMQCNHKFKNKERCGTPHFDEETLKKIFVDVFNSTLDDRDELLQNLAEILSCLTDTSAIDAEIERERDSLQAAGIVLKNCVDENKHRALNQDKYEKHYKRLLDNYEKISSRVSELENAKALQTAKRKETLHIIHALKENNTAIMEFDESLFHSLVDSITVISNTELIFAFKNGDLIPHRI